MPEGLDDGELKALLYPPPSAIAAERRSMPDWAVVHRELAGGVGTQDGFCYSWLCDLYREWVGRLKPTLRQVHTAGERGFVDFAGHAVEVIDGATGEVRRAEVSRLTKLRHQASHPNPNTVRKLDLDMTNTCR